MQEQQSPRKRVVVFTSPIEIGRKVAAAAARNLTVSVMELGDNNAYIVTNDIDLNTAASAAVFRSFIHQRSQLRDVNVYRR